MALSVSSDRTEPLLQIADVLDATAFEAKARARSSRGEGQKISRPRVVLENEDRLRGQHPCLILNTVLSQ